ncbi:glycosyltransferase [Lachnospiraceae bacterium ZAX-1]
MEILFLGYAINKEMMSKLGIVSAAGSKMQLNILKELNMLADELKIITICPMAPFPKMKNIIIKRKEIVLDAQIKANQIPFINVPIIKQVTQILSVWAEGRKYLKQHKDAVIFTFNMYPQVGVPAVLWKKRHRNKLISLLADLPIDDNYQRRGISRMFRTGFDNSTRKNIKECDKVIVLNEYAALQFAPEIPYMVMEGGIEPEVEYVGTQVERESQMKCMEIKSTGEMESRNSKEKVIVYGGSLAEYSGVKQLIEAMKYVKNKDILLKIYGSGTLKDSIEHLERQNIIYCGTVSNDKMLQIQRSAWLLVNPRPIDDPIAMVTFPSKIFEYMASGTPVLSTRLNGFTQEYGDKLFFSENNKPQTLGKKINEIEHIDERKLLEMAQKASAFVLKEKNWTRQTRKIYDFLK